MVSTDGSAASNIQNKITSSKKAKQPAEDGGRQQRCEFQCELCNRKKKKKTA